MGDTIIEGYLTEDKLCEILRGNFPDCNITKQKKFDRYKIDYFIEDLNIAIEFDGHHHYTQPDCFTADIKKDKRLAEEFGVSKVIRIPYFIQMSKNNFENLFGVVPCAYNEYTDGFIDKYAVLPGAFSYQGNLRFYKEINSTYISSRQQVFDSIKYHNQKNLFKLSHPDTDLYHMLIQHNKEFLRQHEEFLSAL